MNDTKLDDKIKKAKAKHPSILQSAVATKVALPEKMTPAGITADDIPGFKEEKGNRIIGTNNKPSLAPMRDRIWSCLAEHIENKEKQREQDQTLELAKNKEQKELIVEALECHRIQRLHTKLSYRLKLKLWKICLTVKSVVFLLLNPATYLRLLVVTWGNVATTLKKCCYPSKKV